MWILIPLLGIFTVALGQDTCPAFGDWRPTTENCLWFPLNEMRQNMLDGCDIQFDASQFPTPPPLPQPIMDQLPGKCGHCSFKFTCRKRAASDQCFPIDGKHDQCGNEQCEGCGDVCDMPKAPMINSCQWGMFMEMLRQCINRPDIPEWKREEYKKWGERAPDANCIEKDGRCKCCCHPFKPSRDGSSCVKQTAPDCQPYSNWNDWSQCLWFPLASLASNFQAHCSLNYGTKAGKEAPVVELPEGMQIPDNCGFCSFKVRCRKRPREDNNGQKKCFPVEADKKACGPDDCPTCGNVCTLPKIGPSTKKSCNWNKHIRTFLKTKLSKINKMPYWRRRGMQQIVRYLPIGNCIEKDGKCKCCCHPYEPNEDGTECRLKTYCKLPEDLGINIFESFMRRR